MKKILLTSLLFCLFAPINVNADKKPLGDSLYWELSDGTLTISGNGEMPNTLEPWYNKKGIIRKVVIEYGVSTIKDMAFSGCKSLSSVTLPNSMKSIGESAFSDCTSLAFVEIPNSVTLIGESAFRDCINLQFVDIPSSVTSIEDMTFYACTKLSLVTIPNSVTSIGALAFTDCKCLTSITIPNSVTSIGEFAFQNCTGLKSIIIPNSVTFIGKGAFSLCSGLTSINIPNSVTYIGTSAFTGETAYSYYEGRIVSIPQWLINKGSEEWNRCGLSEASVIAYKSGVKLYNPSIIKASGGYASAVELMNGSTKYYKVSKGGKYGLTNAEGKVIVPAEMEALELAGTGYLRYKLNGFWGVMNYSGKILIDTNRGYTKIGDYVSFTKRFPYEMTGWKGECDAITGRQISKIKVETPQKQIVKQEPQPNPKDDKDTIIIKHDPIPMQVWKQCEICLGSGKCQACANIVWGSGSSRECLSCGWSRKCQWCAGQGGHYEVEYR